MVPIVASVLDPLTTAVIRDLSSRYCPVDKATFLGRFGASVAVLAVITLLLFAIARFGAKDARRKRLTYFAACGVAVFALGYGALVTFGLSGCAGGYTAGLTWDWPW